MPRLNRSVWMHGQTVAQFKSATSLLHLLAEETPQFRLVLTSGRSDTVGWLQTRFVDDLVCHVPRDIPFVPDRFIKQISPAVVILLESAEGFGRRALRKTAEAGVPVMAIDVGGKNGAIPKSLLSHLLRNPETSHISVKFGKTAEILKKRGFPLINILISTDLGDEKMPPGEEMRTADNGRPGHERTTLKVFGVLKKQLSGFSPEPRVNQSWRVPTWRDRAGQSSLWKACARAFMGRRIDDWESLRTRLGHPHSVLCLGNGPSSEDPRVAAFEHDCLLRVNWRWKQRGILTDPDLVLVGDAASLHKLSSRIFGFWNIAQEYGLLLRYLITHGPRLLEYVTMERISPLIRDHDWPARPSNGALMLVAGTALQPERLIIAGMDLFLHPQGRYPGDGRSVNQYSSVHSRDVDLAIIRRALTGFRGELIILSDALRRSLSELEINDTPDRA